MIDVGCGPGAVAVRLADVVGPTGSVSAVDRDPDALAAARALAEASGLANVALSPGGANDTGLEPGRYDVVMMRHVLAHNGGREQAIVDHLAELVRPGGCVYLIDVEMTGVRMHPTNPDWIDIGDRYTRFHAERGNDTSVGLRLRDLLEASALEVLAFEAWYQVIDVRPGMRPPSWAARDAMVDAEWSPLYGKVSLTLTALAAHLVVERWAAAFARADEEERRATVFVPTFLGIGRRPA